MGGNISLETELDPDTGNPGGQDVCDSAECSAQVRRRHSRAAVDQVEHRDIHVHRVSVTASELLGQPEAGHRYSRAVLRTKFFHTQCDRALQQPGVREGLSPLSLRSGCGPHIDGSIDVRGKAVIGVRSSFPRPDILDWKSIVVRTRRRRPDPLVSPGHPERR